MSNMSGLNKISIQVGEFEFESEGSQIEVDEKFIIDTGFVSKLFSMLTVEVNSQNISSNRNR